MWTQVRLQQGNTILTCWLQLKPGAKVGKLVDLKGESGLWRIIWVSSIKLEVPPRTDWRVGGLE